MGWEQRGGRSYYYAKERQGDRVVSTYLGGGARGQSAEEFVQDCRQDRAFERQIAQEKKAELTALERPLRETAEALRLAAAELLREAGLHQHKGTWRRKR